MNVSLTPELEQFIQEKVDCGMYTSASEVIRESLRLMSSYNDVRKQRTAELNQAIDVGIAQLDRKQFTEGAISRDKMKQKIATIARDK